MTLEDSIHALRLRVFAEAEQSGNVSATCRRYGWSRARFYELRQRFREYGADGLRPKPQKRLGRPPGLSVEDEHRKPQERLPGPRVAAHAGEYARLPCPEGSA